MAEQKKGIVKRVLGIVALAGVTTGLALLPRLTAGAAEEEHKASVLSVRAERRDITETLHGGGYLEGGEEELVSVPENVIIREYLVHGGDTVEAGDDIARVDRVSVMTAVTGVQKALDSIKEDMEALNITYGLITADAEGNLTAGGKTLTDEQISDYAEYTSLAERHRVYEEMLADLFKMYTTGTVKTEKSGIVDGLDASLPEKLSAIQKSGGVLQRLAANLPIGDDSKSYQNQVALVISAGNGSYQLLTGYSWDTLANGNYLDDLAVADSHTEMWAYIDTAYVKTYPIGKFYTYANDAWEETAEPTAGDLLMVTYDGNGQPAWAVKGEKPAGYENILKIIRLLLNPSPDPGGNGGSGNGGSGNGGSGNGGFPGGGGGWGGGFGGGFGGGYGTTEEELYSTDTVTLCSIVPVDELSVRITVDEADMASVALGMTAEMTAEALPGRSFTGTVTDVSRFGSSSGGSAKFEVTLTVPYEEDMLPGMNCAATFELRKYENVLTVPVAALNDREGKTTVYTGYDEKEELLLNSVEVTLGVSDGEYAQILSGITEGQSLWYEYYDRLVIDNEAKASNPFGR